MRLGRLHHDRLGWDSCLLADGCADPVGVVAGDNGEIQDHHTEAALARFEDDGLGKERVDHRLGRAVFAGSASRQVNPGRRGDVDHGGAGFQLVGPGHGLLLQIER